jgi:two-component system, OmpR family, sensor kinase
VSGTGPVRTLLVVGVNLDDVDAALARARWIQIAGSAAVLAALAALGWWVLRLGVRPLVGMASTADQIAAGDLSRRVEQLDERTEAGRLGSAFNTMLAQIEEAFHQRGESEAKVRQFAADASHELRTPLTSIRGYAELWEAGGLRDPGQLDEAMRRMADEANRMSTLVEDLMLLARFDRGRTPEREQVRLDELTADGVRDALAVDPERPIVLDTAPAVVLGDEHALRQVIANLLTNARVHTPPGTPVRVRVWTGADGVRLEVADDGPGLPPDIAERVFERFYRTDPARARSGASGSGLGLAIVRSVTEAHGGTAAVHTALGEGSRFVVHLPAASEVTAGSQPAPS